MTRLLAGLFALAVAGSLPAAPVPAHLFPKEQLFFPTQVGAEWEYDDNGMKCVYFVAKVEEKDGAKLAAVHLRHREEKTTQYSYTVEVTKTGVREVSYFNGKIDPPTPLVKWPCKKDDKWESPRYWFRCGGLEEVTVTAGTFQALRVEQSYELGPGKERYTTTTWYAPGVGPVRIQYRAGSTRDLVKFTPGKAAPAKK